MVIRRTTRPQFLVVLTYFLVAEDARTLEFCYPDWAGRGWVKRGKEEEIGNIIGLRAFGKSHITFVNNSEKLHLYYKHYTCIEENRLKIIYYFGAIINLETPVTLFRGPVKGQLGK